MKSTVYIHPGLPKTGTTAIQIFLRSNQESLAKKGVSYPLFSRKFPGVRIERNGHFLSRTVTDSAFKEDCLQKIISLAEDYDKIVLTDEELWSSACDQSDFWVTLRDRLAEHHIALKMIVYLRRQDAFMASLWAQKIKGVKVRSFPFKKFIQRELYDVDYYRYLQDVSAIIGRENVLVRPYEFSQFLGKDHSIVSDFLIALDVDYDDSLVFKNERVNISLGGNILEVKRQLNRVKTYQDKAWRTVKYFEQVQKEWMEQKKYHDCSTWLSGERAEYMKRFDDDNRKIALEYLGREDGVLFEAPLPSNDPEKYAYTCKELRAILKCLEKKLLADPKSPFSPSEVKDLCSKTWTLIYANDDYVHRCPLFRKFKRRLIRKSNNKNK